MTLLSRIENPVEGLYASAPEPLPFAPTLDIRSFLLRRERGDILIYGAPGSVELGPVARRYLNHSHEAAFVPEGLAAPLFVHAAERAAVEPRHHVRGTFRRRHMLDEDFEVIPTPGHTPGATAYLWDSGSHRFLFTGDTIFLRGGEWRTALLDSSDRATYLQSLDLIGDLDFDVLVPWAAGHGEPSYAVTSRAATRRRVDALIARLRSGEGR